MHNQLRCTSSVFCIFINLKGQKFLDTWYRLPSFMFSHFALIRAVYYSNELYFHSHRKDNSGYYPINSGNFN